MYYLSLVGLLHARREERTEEAAFGRQEESAHVDLHHILLLLLARAPPLPSTIALAFSIGGAFLLFFPFFFFFLLSLLFLFLCSFGACVELFLIARVAH